ncbi:MAG: AAA family ATPase, partial [Candidatus Altiarchaeota archaeon]|nr:AAA family ATPase [Candidatus Altiarchaeota archaeon]
MGAKLKTAEAFRNDVGRGIVRVDSSVMEELGLTSGDVVEIIGKRTTVAIIWRGHPQDEGLGLIRMDGFTRYNCGVKLGDKVIIKKSIAKDAESVEFAPTESVKISGNFDQYLKHRLLGRVLLEGDRIVVGVLGSSIPFVITKTKPEGVVIVNDYTQVSVKTKPIVSERKLPKITYEDIGGLETETQKIREMVELPMKHPELFKKLGIEPPKGILLYGPPGCGKTLLAKAVAGEASANFFVINGPEVVSKWYGQSEQNLRKIFKDAQENSPSIIFIDEIDAIAP